MRLPSLSELRIAAASVGVVGAVSVLFGGATLLTGVTAVGVVKLGEYLKPRQALIGELLRNGSLFVGGGLFTVGAVGVVCDRLNDIEWNQQINHGIFTSVIPSNCKACKYFSENQYLPCAVHPVLKEDCSDWENIG